MPAGTIALTNKSATVAGTGTSFTTELKAGDFVYVNVGGAPYTLVAANVTSDTQLTLAVAFDGPTTSGLAWSAVPASLQVAITQKILNDFASVARGRILDFQNWQAIYSDTASVTVTRPDRTQFTGPSWGYMANQYSAINETLKTKLDKSGGEISGPLTVSKDFTSKGNTTLSGALYQSGGATFYNGEVVVDSGDSVAKKVVDAGNGYYNSGFLKAVLQGRGAYQDARGAFAALLCQEESGKTFRGYININGFGQSRLYEFNYNGNASAPGTWVSNSDERLKENIERIIDPLEKMKLIKGVTWTRLDGVAPGIGFIAQDVMKVFPDSVFVTGNRKLDDGTTINDVLSPDTAGVAAALHHEAILAIMDKVDKQDVIINELLKRMKAVDGLDS